MVIKSDKGIMNMDCYAVKHKDANVVDESRSGGIFTAVSDYVLSQGGVVYGCVLEDDLLAYHRRTVCKEERDRMRGSKYIQSKLGDTFNTVKKDLDNGLQVLFTGTSCQISGLKNFLKNDYESLICIDLVCHGVPSPKIWKAFINWIEKSKRVHIVSANFRNKKKFGWEDHVETLKTVDNREIDSRVFKWMVYNHEILRPACYECKFKSISHPGDITIADYWGIEKVAPEFNDNKGTSLVLVNTDKGKRIFEAIKEDILFKETNIEDSMQPAFIAPFQCPIDRNEFWIEFENKPFVFLAKKYGDYGVLNKTRHMVGKMLRKIGLRS